MVWYGMVWYGMVWYIIVSFCAFGAAVAGEQKKPDGRNRERAIRNAITSSCSVPNASGLNIYTYIYVHIRMYIYIYIYIYS